MQAPECDLCGRVFRRKQNLVAHMRTVHLPRALGDLARCRQCGNTFTTPRNLRRHVQSVHDARRRCLQCDECTTLFEDKHSLAAHIQSAHERPRCARTLTGTRTLARHAGGCTQVSPPRAAPAAPADHHQFAREVRRLESRFRSARVCGACAASFRGEPALRRHVKREHSFKEFYAFCRAALLRRHTSRTRADTELYAGESGACRAAAALQCAHCDRLFTAPTSRDLHTRTFHPQDSIVTSSQPGAGAAAAAGAGAGPRCAVCVKDFSSRKTLRRHINKFHPEFDTDELTRAAARRTLPPACRHCVAALHSPEALRRHDELRTQGGAGAVFRCAHCELQYDTLEFSIQRHRLALATGGDTELMPSSLCTTEMSDHSHDELEWDGNTCDVSACDVSVKDEPTDQYSS